MKTVKHSLGLLLILLSFLPSSSFAQTIVEKTFPFLKLVTDASTISSTKKYMLVADDGENMYAMKDAELSKGKASALKITSETVLSDTVFFNLTRSGEIVTIRGAVIGEEYRYTDSKGLSFGSKQHVFYAQNTSRYDNNLIICDKTGEIYLGTNDERTYFKIYSLDTLSIKAHLPALIYEYDTSIGTISIKASEGYGTFYLDKDYVMPDGVTGYYVSGTVDEKLSLEKAYESGKTVPANTALVVYGKVGEYKVYAPEATASGAVRKSASAGGNVITNYLYGTVTDGTTSAPEEGKDYYFYKLCYLVDADNNKTLGFYWGTDGGKAFENKANRAYMALEKVQASQSMGFAFPGNDPSAIVLPRQDASEVCKGIFTLTGVKMSVPNTQQLPKGIYIVDGCKRVIK